MPNINPIKKAKYIEDEFRRYISSSYHLNNAEYNDQIQTEIKSTDLLKGPFISKSLEFQTSCTLNDLISEGLVSSEFRKLGDMKLDRKLRYHQEQAIRKIHDGKNLIITTGTGSGKTESFLYPILNEILQEEDLDKPGVRAIFLFPMNALVNDQFDRVRKILNVYPKIKYAFYTGNTKNKESDSIREYIEKSTGNKSAENELIDREQIRAHPPHLLFTNYSMLEYMLLRPKDDAILNPQNTENWKFIVLDEAHTYKGALGIEIGMLLRRLQNRINQSVQFILTSATLGVETEDGLKRIQDFGYRLTSGKFDKNDILFSKRIILDRNNIKYSVNPQDYLELYESYNMDKIDELILKYKVNTKEVTLESKLYDFMLSDKNLYELNDFLSSTKEFSLLVEEMKKYGFYNVEQLTAFIDLVCKCIKNGLKIMDLKYHTFIRSLAGSFATFGKNPRVALTERYYIDGKRAFEIGFCEKCNMLYIIGVEKNNRLLHDKSVDIYESYDESEQINVDYYLVEDQLKDIEIELEKLQKYELCTCCGNIVPCNLSNKKDVLCEHSDADKIFIYKVDKSDSKIRNNLTYCPSCGGKSKSGLISTINMGKESATALITQIYFEALRDDELKSSEEVVQGNNKLLNIIKKPTLKMEKAKQILSFSDSRQQASFSVKFAESNHHRFLRKRLIVEILNQNNRNSMTFETAEVMLDSIISKNDLFDTSNEKEGSISTTKQAKITLLNEILNVDGIYSGEGLGLFYFNHKPLEDLMGELSDDSVTEFFKHHGFDVSISKKQFSDYLQALIGIVRMIPAIQYEGFTFEDRENFFAYRMFDNHIKLKKSERVINSFGKDISNSVYALISESKKKSKKFETLTEKVFKVDKETADKIIEKVWEVLITSNVLSEFDKVNELYNVNATDFTLHHYSDSKWYRCDKCKSMTRFNIKDICPHCFNENTLKDCDPDVIWKNNYYRNKYINKEIEKLVYKEHTAQLSAEKAKERQNEFKNKKINYLSCSTTFEMGIDIGSLENVLLRNVPPSPANYVQRAGRAGRGQDSSAFVLTYCSSTSHDYTFYQDPLKMVEGVCETPVFIMENAKIIYRHLLALALSKFFKKYPLYFDTVNSFFIEDGYDNFKKYLESKPEDLIIDSDKILTTTDLAASKNGVWIDDILGNKEFDLDLVRENILSLLKEFEERKQEAVLENNPIASYYINQITKITTDKDLISKLADGNLIPKYGFPTDLVELKINDLEVKNYDLTRDMKIALSEYAPDSEIMVDKKIIVSKYVDKADNLLIMYSYECPKCHKNRLQFTEIVDFECSDCHYKVPGKVGHSFITPKYGFTGLIKNNTSTILKPKRSYSSPVKYVGNGFLDGNIIKVNDLIEFCTMKNEELLIVNENPFFICQKCGFAFIDQEHGILPHINKPHKNKRGRNCDCEKLMHRKLGFSYKTDVLKLIINEPFEDYNQGISVLYALLEGISIAFEIERNDIDGIYINEDNKNVFVLFDTVPGGAGHVKRLLNKYDMLKAFKVALNKVSQECCDTACYNCLKNYKNQKYHDFLRRELAKKMLEKIYESFNKEDPN